MTQAVVQPASDILGKTLEVYEKGQYLQAYKLVEDAGPMQQWTDPDAMILAGRLLGNIGAPRLSTAIHLRAWRQHPKHAAATFYFAASLAWRFGPLKAWRFLSENPVSEDADPIYRADTKAIQALIASQFRDFNAASELLKQAEDLAPDHSWVYVEKSAVQEKQDAYDEALATVEHALAIQPMYRPAVQQQASLLVTLGRDDDALRVLKEANAQLESYALSAQLAQLQLELGLNEEARDSIERAAELAPVMEKMVGQWMNAMRFSAAYRSGEVDRSLELAKKIDDPYFELVVKNMAKADDDSKRVQLDVPYVRQHHMTCAPATLSAISRFWQKDTDHLELAEEICYDGTPLASERKWAEDHGWVARDFTLDWESTVALIDRGIPFTLTTSETTTSHLQAVIGYDSRKKVLLVRDPFVREVREFLAEQTIERYAHVNIRAMLMVPTEKASLLDGIDLPSAEQWDQFYKVMCALKDHDRDTAEQALDHSQQNWPDHPLTYDIRMSVARYDSKLQTQMECADWMLEKYPDSGFWAMMKVGLLMQNEQVRDAQELLKELAYRKDREPVFMLRYARVLREDASQWGNAMRLTRRALRMWREDPEAYHTLGGILWDLRQFDEAHEVYRFASCLNDKDEDLAGTYFLAARYLKREKEALAQLQQRYNAFGHKSPGPAKTLFWALSDIGRLSKAFDVLDHARKRLPDDSMLAVFAAEMHARRGESAHAVEILNAVRKQTHEAVWLRTAAAVASYAGKPNKALELWQRIIKKQPMAVDAHRMLAASLDEVQGRDAADAHLQKTVDEFPHHIGLNELFIEWIPEDETKRREVAVRKLLEVHSNHPWAHRELAVVLADTQRFDEALEHVELARKLAPSILAHYNVLGHVLAKAGRMQDAKNAYRNGLMLDIDSGWTFTRLLALTHSREERRIEFDFMREQMTKQVTYGEAILTFAEQSRDTLEHDEILAELTMARKKRPDLWQSWSALGNLHLLMKAYDKAENVFTKATRRFPLNPQLWMDLAEAHRLQLKGEKELAALKQAMKARPDYMEPLRRLAEAYEREGAFGKSNELLERAVTRDPGDVRNHGFLANTQWALNKRDEAIATITTVCRREPNYRWAWAKFDEWSMEMGKPDAVVELAREVAERRPGDVNSWIVLATCLVKPEEFEECIKAIKQAIKIDPHGTSGYDKMAVVLARARQFDKARAACFPKIFGDQVPVGLRGRAAWVEAERGNLRLAIEKMQAILAGDDSFYWGWNELAGWHQQINDFAGLVVAAENLARLAPDDSEALEQLASAKLQNDDREGAKDALARAFALDPKASFAAHHLFRMQLEDDETGKAADTLDRRRSHIEHGEYLGYRVQLLCKTNVKEAVDTFRALAITPAPQWAIGLAIDSLDDAGKTNAWPSIVEKSLDDENLNEHAFADMIAYQAHAEKYRYCDQCLATFENKPKMWQAGMIRYLSMLSRQGQQKKIQAIQKTFKDRLRADDELWGQMGDSLSEAGLSISAINWLSDWKQRKDVKPWMLNSLSIANRIANRWDHAAEASRAALSLPPDHSTQMHELWLAFDFVRAWNPEALDVLVNIEYETLNTYYQPIHEMVTAAAYWIAPTGHIDEQTLRDAKKSLSQLPKKYPYLSKDNLLPSLFKQMVGIVGKSSGGLGGTMWAWWTKMKV